MFGPISGHNQVYRANMTGGIVGWLGDSSRRALRYAFEEANRDGQEVVFVVPDTTNKLRTWLYLAILILTFGIWCPEPGYLVITQELDQSPVPEA